MTGYNLPATFDHSEDDFFPFRPTPGDLFGSLALVHIAGLLPDEGFVNLDFTAEFGSRLVPVLPRESDAA